ncbi:hypothetical protein V7024_01225 [Bacillus sp. JJ864]|uniref:hypothetical protein n=1 Tax=Bacillus sp. JJ864 TaxID=3122975 RepID=UPI002FFD6C5E
MKELTTIKTLKLKEEAKKNVKQVVVEEWKMPKNEAIHLLPDEEMKQFAIQFYECAERYYPDENLVDDALDMIENGAKFFESVNLWFAKEMKVSE